MAEKWKWKLESKFQGRVIFGGGEGGSWREKAENGEGMFLAEGTASLKAWK